MNTTQQPATPAGNLPADEFDIDSATLMLHLRQRFPRCKTEFLESRLPEILLGANAMALIACGQMYGCETAPQWLQVRNHILSDMLTAADPDCLQMEMDLQAAESKEAEEAAEPDVTRPRL